MLRRLLALAALVASPVAARPLPAHPALWKVSDADTTIWLFGTIHLLPKNTVWRDRRLEAAIAGAQRLVIEAKLGDDPQAVARLMLTMGRASGLPPLLERVPPARRDALARLIKRSGAPAAMLDGMKSWAAAMMLFGATMTDIGLAPGSGVEPQLEASFTAGHKPIDGLETAEQQLGYLDGLSEADQRDFLVSMLDDPAESRREFAAMLAAWTRGDDAAIARSFDQELTRTPGLRDALLTRRNAAWAKWIEARMAQPGALLVAVGAGHLAGPAAVPALLRAAGLKVERVR